MSDFLIRGSIADIDPRLFELTQVEAERQYRRLILIPSESTAPLAVREILASAFQNIYAEGYPPEDTRKMIEDEILDYGVMLSRYRRYSDPRYYKGVEYADIIEALARQRCAELFATDEVKADDIYVNVQPLSGSPANSAVYDALVDLGDTVMGMNLLHGGHLSHGSPVSRSGKFFNIVHYGVDPKTEKIDFNIVEDLARKYKPKMIIAGFTSYSWIPDWKQFREIADAVGAYFLADIAHIAGMVAAGVVASPVGIADAVSFTTHKSLCGPRGAVILATSRKLSRKIDRAVFPGEQGGPHLNTIAAQALTFKLANTDQFKALQKQILINCKVMSDAIEKTGFHICYGGTNSHLTNVDCRSVKGPDGTPLSGDQAARILDVAGIVVNRNTIPGDRAALRPSGIRLGTPWITQRGFKEKESKMLGGLIGQLLNACTPYSLAGRKRLQKRAKVDFEVLNDVRGKVRDLAESMGIDFEPEKHGYPHFYYIDDILPDGKYAVIDLSGDRAEELLQWATAARFENLSADSVISTCLLANGEPIDAILTRMEEDGWHLMVPAERANLVLTWLRDLSDGYIGFDPEDPTKKLPGPVVVELNGMIDELPEGSVQADGVDKPWYIGVKDGSGEALPKFEWKESENVEIRRTALYETHKAMGAQIVPFAGWEMPVWYSSVIEEHLATREAAGLFDVSHMGVYQVEGSHAGAFLDSVVGNDVSALMVGASLYTQFIDPDGNVIDDGMVYRRGKNIYLVVVNASNDDKDWAWLNAVHDGRVCIDSERPWSLAFGRDCLLRNLRDPKEGDDMRVDIAIQGPKSRDIVLGLGCDAETAKRLKALKWAGVMEGVFGGFELVVSRTGYTGERVAYELFIHPQKSVELWKALLKTGEPFGMKPAGLGARDSLRTEAGLPLYGNEMGGNLSLTVGDAGFNSYVKVYKPWFIGRKAFMAQEARRKSVVVRFRFDDKGVRMAHHGDPVVDRRGHVIGVVTSCAIDREGYLLGQAYLDIKFTAEGTPIKIFQGASKKPIKPIAELAIGDRMSIPTPAKVLSRFPARTKRKAK